MAEFGDIIGINPHRMEENIMKGFTDISHLRCPVCSRPLPFRLARGDELLYGEEENGVWGEKNVLIYDYERIPIERVNEGIKREWVAEGTPILDICECIYRKAVEVEMKEMGIPAGLVKKSFENFEVHEENETAFNACRRFAREFDPAANRGVALHGPVGVGKTHLVAATMGEIIRRSVAERAPLNIRFFSVPKLFRDLHWLKREGNAAREQALLESLTTCSLLVMDDMGLEQITEDSIFDLFLIINGRLNNDNSLLLTTNFSPTELKEKVGMRIADRLLEACRWHEIRGESHRSRGITVL